MFRVHHRSGDVKDFTTLKTQAQIDIIPGVQRPAWPHEHEVRPAWRQNLLAMRRYGHARQARHGGGVIFISVT